MRVNFKLLSTFLAVAEHASFRKAADQAHLSLPAVSMQIRQLEDQLGTPLFQRTTRRVELTAEGEALMISARKAMAELDGAILRIQKAADVQLGHLSVGCVPTVAGTRLPAVIVEYARRHPAISIRLRELTQPALLEAVRRRLVYFGIGPAPDPSAEFDTRDLFSDDFVALVPARHEAAARTAITLKDLARMPLLTLGGSQFHRELMAALADERLEPALHYDFTHVSTLVAMVEAGLGIGVMPAVAVPPGAPVTALRIVRPTLRRRIVVITIRGHVLPPAAARFVELCEARMRAPTSHAPGGATGARSRRAS